MLGFTSRLVFIVFFLLFFFFFFFFFFFVVVFFRSCFAALGKRELAYMLLVHLYLYLAYVTFLSFSLPRGVGRGLWIVIVAFPGRLFRLLSTVKCFKPPVVYATCTDHSKTVVLVLFLVCVPLWFCTTTRFMLSLTLLFVIMFFFCPVYLWSPQLGKRESWSSICFTCICMFIFHYLHFLSFCSLPLCVCVGGGVAADFDCDPWTFHLIFCFVCVSSQSIVV